MTDLWIAPDACTLPTVEQPLRIAEFDAIFESYVLRVDQLGPTKVRMILAGPDDLIEQVQDLADRESACCSFFRFALGKSRGDRPGQRLVQLDIEVPAGRSAVLAALANRAKSAETGAR
jgi:hypothetical protein